VIVCVVVSSVSASRLQARSRCRQGLNFDAGHSPIGACVLWAAHADSLPLARPLTVLLPFVGAHAALDIVDALDACDNSKDKELCGGALFLGINKMS
jgi:hypothetical protein